MAESKKSFILYADLLYTVEKMPAEKAGELFKIILQYVNDQNPVTSDLLVEIAFEPVKQQLKRDLNRWEGIKEKRAEFGRKGGVKSGEVRKQNQANEAKASKSKQNEAVNDNGNVTVNVNDTVINKNKGEMLSPFETAFNDYLEMRKKIKKPPTDRAIELIRLKLVKMASTEDERILILEQSVRNCWQDVFPLKIDYQKEKGSAEKERVSKFEQNNNSVNEANLILHKLNAAQR